MIRRPTVQVTSQPIAKVFVAGGWVTPVPTVPLERGVVAVVRFARECLLANARLQHQLLELTRDDTAETTAKD